MKVHYLEIIASDVDAVWERAASMTIRSGVGHVMMLEEPEEFMRLVEKCLR